MLKLCNLFLISSVGAAAFAVLAAVQRDWFDVLDCSVISFLLLQMNLMQREIDRYRRWLAEDEAERGFVVDENGNRGWIVK